MGCMVVEYTEISVVKATKAEFQSFRRQVEAAHDRDFTEDELTQILLSNAPEPGETDTEVLDGEDQ